MAEHINLRRQVSNLVRIYRDNDSRHLHLIQMNVNPHTHKRMATWLLDGYPSVHRLQSDQKSWHNITKTLLETSWLYSALAIWKLWQGITGRMHCQLIYCHNFLIKWHCKEAFAIKRKEKNLLQQLTKCCSSVPQLCSQPTTSICLACKVEDASAKLSDPAVKFLQHLFIFFLVIFIHPSQSTWFSLRPLTHPATISPRPLSTFWMRFLAFP